MKSSKISVESYDECNANSHSTTSLSNMKGLVIQRSNDGINNMDCTIMTVYDNIFGVSETSSSRRRVLTSSAQSKWQTDFIMVDVVSDNTSLGTTSSDNSNSSDVDTWLSECDAIIISSISRNISVWSDTKLDHLWLGICFRQYGTNYNCRQRVAMMMIRLLTTFAVTSLFYGIDKGSTIGDWSLSFYESMLGFIPLFLIEKCIRSRKPTPEEIDDMMIENMIDANLQRNKFATVNSITPSGTAPATPITNDLSDRDSISVNVPVRAATLKKAETHILLKTLMDTNREEDISNLEMDLQVGAKSESKSQAIANFNDYASTVREKVQGVVEMIKKDSNNDNDNKEGKKDSKEMDTAVAGQSDENAEQTVNDIEANNNNNKNEDDDDDNENNENEKSVSAKYETEYDTTTKALAGMNGEGGDLGDTGGAGDTNDNGFNSNKAPASGATTTNDNGLGAGGTATITIIGGLNEYFRAAVSATVVATPATNNSLHQNFLFCFFLGFVLHFPQYHMLHDHIQQILLVIIFERKERGEAKVVAPSVAPSVAAISRGIGFDNGALEYGATVTPTTPRVTDIIVESKEREKAGGFKFGAAVTVVAIGIDIDSGATPAAGASIIDNIFKKEYDKGVPAPTITDNCFERERDEWYGFEFGVVAPAVVIVVAIGIGIDNGLDNGYEYNIGATVTPTQASTTTAIAFDYCTSMCSRWN